MHLLWPSLLRLLPPLPRSFLTAPARANKFFDKEGRALYPPEHERIMGRWVWVWVWVG